jgi:hypothetical protein
MMNGLEPLHLMNMDANDIETIATRIAEYALDVSSPSMDKRHAPLDTRLSARTG